MRRPARAQRVGVEAGAVADPAGLRAAVAERQDDGVIGQSGLDLQRAADGAAAELDLADMAPAPGRCPNRRPRARHRQQPVEPGKDAQFLRQARRNEDGVVPREPRDRIGALLQPAVVGEPPVVDLVVGDKAHLEALGPTAGGWARRRGSRRRHRRAARVARPAARPCPPAGHRAGNGGRSSPDRRRPAW